MKNEPVHTWYAIQFETEKKTMKLWKKTRIYIEIGATWKCRAFAAQFREATAVTFFNFEFLFTWNQSIQISPPKQVDARLNAIIHVLETPEEFSRKQ